VNRGLSSLCTAEDYKATQSAGTCVLLREDAPNHPPHGGAAVLEECDAVEGHLVAKALRKGVVGQLDLCKGTGGESR